MPASTKSSSAPISQAPALSKALGIKTGHTMVLIDAPSGFQEAIKLPKGVDVHTAARRGVEFDVAMLFVPTAKMLSARLGPLSKSMKPGGSLWVAFPKKGSGMSTDLSDVEVKRIGAAVGAAEGKPCVIDKTWSGMRVIIHGAPAAAAAK